MGYDRRLTDDRSPFAATPRAPRLATVAEVARHRAACSRRDFDFDFSHRGRDEGIIGSVVFYPERGVGLVVLTNATSREFLNAVAGAFRREFVR